jgi:hypothetical protein
MATTTGATTIMAETRARDYYRRLGFNTLTIRDRPGVRRRANIHQIHEYNLSVDDVVELIVYPELTVRSKPWQFWGKVVRFYDDNVILRQLAGEQTGTLVRIPFRYFEDGRVYRKDILDADDE